MRRSPTALGLAYLWLCLCCSTEAPQDASGNAHGASKARSLEAADDAPESEPATPSDEAGYRGHGRKVPGHNAVVAAQRDPHREIVRRVVRAHIDDIRECYPPDATVFDDRVAITIELDSEGRVVRSEVAEMTRPDSKTAACIAAAIARWTFPKPADGESMEVTYPFSLPSD